eukprot:366563-Chlamydomonas_euryale.AAC.4
MGAAGFSTTEKNCSTEFDGAFLGRIIRFFTGGSPTMSMSSRSGAVAGAVALCGRAMIGGSTAACTQILSILSNPGFFCQSYNGRLKNASGLPGLPGFASGFLLVSRVVRQGCSSGFWGRLILTLWHIHDLDIRISSRLRRGCRIQGPLNDGGLAARFTAAYDRRKCRITSWMHGIRQPDLGVALRATDPGFGTPPPRLFSRGHDWERPMPNADPHFLVSLR